MKVGSLFAGIGGFDLGLERAGMEIKWQVEIDPFCQKVLAKHWPKVKRYEDIKKVGKHNLEPVDLICGGFPCQPYSVAGKRRGEEDDRHLWPEMLCVIKEVRPAWVVGENVPGIIPLFLDNVLSDLESEGYATRTFVLPACAFDARHRRDRVWVVAHATSKTKRNNIIRGRDNNCYGKKVEWRKFSDCNTRMVDGIPNRVDRLKSLGNAVVPQVVEHIGRMIMEFQAERRKDG